jgi:VWFA-related protein
LAVRKMLTTPRRIFIRSAMSAVLPPLGAGFLRGDPAAQQIKVKSELVLVDLIAWDSQERFVGDLVPGEIEIFEDRKRRELAFFERRSLSVGAAIIQASGPPPSREAEIQDSAGKAGASMFFLIDAESIAPHHLPQVKNAIRNFLLSKANSRDRVSLVRLGRDLTILQNESDDIPAFLNSLEGVRSTADNDLQLLRFGQDLDTLQLQMGPEGDPQVLLRNVVALGKNYILREQDHVLTITRCLKAFFRGLEQLPGRKNVLMYSSGFRPKIAMAIQELLLRRLGNVVITGGNYREAGSMLIPTMLGASSSAERMNSLIGEAIDAANRSRVAIYTMDARGLMTRQDVRLRNMGVSGEELMREEISQPQDMLRTVAAGTGGRAYSDTNEMESGIRGVYRDSNDYYDLGFVPANTGKPGRIHQIRVKVKRPQVQISYRTTYVEK